MKKVDLEATIVEVLKDKGAEIAQHVQVNPKMMEEMKAEIRRIRAGHKLEQDQAASVTAVVYGWTGQSHEERVAILRTAWFDHPMARYPHDSHRVRLGNGQWAQTSELTWRTVLERQWFTDGFRSTYGDKGYVYGSHGEAINVRVKFGKITEDFTKELLAARLECAKAAGCDKKDFRINYREQTIHYGSDLIVERDGDWNLQWGDDKYKPEDWDWGLMEKEPKGGGRGRGKGMGRGSASGGRGSGSAASAGFDPGPKGGGASWSKAGAGTGKG